MPTTTTDLIEFAPTASEQWEADYLDAHRERPELEEVKCRKCGGSGRIGFLAHKWAGRCFECRGTGWVLEAAESDVAMEMVWAKL